MSLRSILCLSLLLAGGCGLLGPSRNPQVTEAVRTQLKDKHFIAVVYEGVTKKEGGTENVFRFQQSALLDEALVELKQRVSDRGPIQSILESQRLPDSGSFKGEDLTKIGKASGADILILGHYSTRSREGLLSTRQEHKLILRAISLQSLEVINSVQTETLGDDEWKKLARVLFRER